MSGGPGSDGSRHSRATRQETGKKGCSAHADADTTACRNTDTDTETETHTHTPSDDSGPCGDADTASHTASNTSQARVPTRARDNHRGDPCCDHGAPDYQRATGCKSRAGWAAEI